MHSKPPLPIPPPILALLLLLFSSGLMAIIPLTSIPIPAAQGIGVIFLVVGFAVGASGFAAFRKVGTPVRPGDEPTQLVTNGPFRITRNPMYLGIEGSHTQTTGSACGDGCNRA